MTSEEMEHAIQFVLEQQAQLTVTVDKLSTTVDRLSVTVDKLSVKVDRNADSVAALLAVTEIQSQEIREIGEAVRVVDERQREADERGRRTDERLNALINTVEKIMSGRKNGKS